MLRISVVIPVFNAEKFVRRAVDSVLTQPEVEELVLVEDDSRDGSGVLCEELDKRHRKVRLLRHPDGRNHGPGPSRNLGVKQATCDWLAFLDADDFYLPDRFQRATSVIEKHEDCDGVCEAVGVHFDDDEGRKRWRQLNRERLTTFRRPVEWQDMFEAQLGFLPRKLAGGHTCTAGFMVRRKAAMEAGLYPEGLSLHQDTAFQARVAATGRVYTGELKSPVAMRGVHSGNRITTKRSYEERRKALLAMWMDLYLWGKGRLSSERLERVALMALKMSVHDGLYYKMEWQNRVLSRLFHLLVFVVNEPGVLRYPAIRKKAVSILCSL